MTHTCFEPEHSHTIAKNQFKQWASSTKIQCVLFNLWFGALRQELNFPIHLFFFLDLLHLNVPFTLLNIASYLSKTHTPYSHQNSNVCKVEL